MLLLLFQQVAGQTIAPDLFVNTNTFYSPTVSPGAVTLAPSLYEDADTFYSPTVTAPQTILPELFVNISVVYEPRVNIGSPSTAYPPNICMRSGFKVRPDQLYRMWNGLLVRAEDYEERHPQDFVRGRRDWQGVPQPRPEPTDTFLDTNDVTRESL